MEEDSVGRPEAAATPAANVEGAEDALERLGSGESKADDVTDVSGEGALAPATAMRETGGKAGRGRGRR